MDRWLAAYVAAWKSYDRDAIGALFTADVRCWYHPFDDPVAGREAIVESWLDGRDAPEVQPDEAGKRPQPEQNQKADEPFHC